MRLFTKSQVSRVIILFNGSQTRLGEPLHDTSSFDDFGHHAMKWLLCCKKWAETRSGEMVVVLPQEAKRHLHDDALLDSLTVVWNTNQEPVSIPHPGSGTDCLIINGAMHPFIPWSGAYTDVRPASCDALIFRDSFQHHERYREFVQVDHTGLVERFVRCHHDSNHAPVDAIGSVSCIRCSDENAHFVIGQINSLGWGMEAVGAITSRLRVVWYDAVTRSTSDNNPISVDAPKSLDDYSDEPDLIRSDAFDRFCKRALDVVFSTIVMLFLLPVFLVISLLVKCTSPGPVFYRDRRQGLNGKEFNCLKFRTMVTGAESMQTELRGKNEVDGPQFKISNDPRITPIGRWLRKYCLDELPQFLNVWRGEMSLVGPRPSPDHENQFCPGWRRARLSTRPGITGLWQVLRTRNEATSDFQQWIYYDLEYVRHRSLWLDVQLLIYTPLALLDSNLVSGLARRLGRRGICTQSPRFRTIKTDSTPLGSASRSPVSHGCETTTAETRPG